MGEGRTDPRQGPRTPVPRRVVLGLVAILILGLACMLAVAEVALRLLDRPREPRVGWVWHRDPAELNEFGFRGHRATGPVEETILLVGDSQVETTRPFAFVPEVYLARALRELTRREIRVVTIGSGGWGQDQQLLALRRLLPRVRPTTVVLWFTPANDLWNNTFPTHMPHDGKPKPTFWLEGEALRGPHAPWGESSPTSGPRLFRVWRRLTGRPLYVTDADWELKLPPAYRASSADAGSARSLVEFEAAARGIDPDTMARLLAPEDFENEKTHYSIALTPRSPRLEYSIRLTRALLREMAQLCERHGARFVVFHTGGPQFRLPAAPTPFEFAGKVVILSNDSATAVIRDVLADVPVIEGTGVPDSFHVSATDRHLNEEGNRYFMTELATRLVNELGLGRKPGGRNDRPAAR